MEEQQNTLKMKIDQKTVFHINYRFKSVCFLLFLSVYQKIRSAFNINIKRIQLAVIEIFTSQN